MVICLYKYCYFRQVRLQKMTKNEKSPQEQHYVYEKNETKKDIFLMKSLPRTTQVTYSDQYRQKPAYRHN